MRKVRIGFVLAVSAVVACGLVSRAAIGESVGATGGAAFEADSARLEATLRALPTRRSAGGEPSHQEGLLKAESWLIEQLAALGYSPERERVYLRKRPEKSAEGAASPPPAPAWHNIIIELPGKEFPNEMYLVGAHFDCVPDTPGADDNGTGVAVLLEMARLLKDQPLKRTVRIVFFNLEEAGLVGSTQHAERLAERLEVAGLKKEEKSAEPGADAGPKIKLRGMISLEMLGFYSSEPDSQKNPFKGLQGLELPTKGDFVALAGVLSARPFIRQLDEQLRAWRPARGEGGGGDGEPAASAASGINTVVFDYSPIAPPDILRSDHAPFLLRGIPAVMVTDTANFRNPNYHKPTDTIETLDLKELTRTASALTHAVAALAGRVGTPDAPPARIEGLPDITAFMPKPAK